MKTVLLTGVTGHSGQYAMERLAERIGECRDLSFRAIVRKNSNTEKLKAWGVPVEIRTGDIQDEAFVRECCRGVDTLLNIVGIIYQPETIARIALEEGVHRIISVHTTGRYSRYKYAAAGYIENDRKVTELCEQFGASRTILRPTMIYGGLDDQNVSVFIRMMDRLPVMPVVNGARYPLQPVHRKDLGHAYADVLLAPEKTANRDYTLSGKEPIDLRDMLTAIAGHLGKKPHYFSVPYPAAYAGACLVYILTLGKKDFREKVQRMVEPRCYPHEKATRDFGYDPVGFEEGVREEVLEYLRTRERVETD